LEIIRSPQIATLQMEIPRTRAMMMSNAPIRVVGGESWVVG
jgi:hypothetical protein